MLRTKKLKKPEISDHNMDIREYLISYAVKWSIPKDTVIERFLSDYTALENRRQSLTYTMEDLTNSYDVAKQSYILRGKAEDDSLKGLENKLARATKELEYVIQRIVRYCGRVVELIDLLPDPEMRAVLELHYIEGLTLEEIRKNPRLSYGRTKINGLHREGLKQLHEILRL